MILLLNASFKVLLLKENETANHFQQDMPSFASWNDDLILTTQKDKQELFYSYKIQKIKTLR